MQQNFSVTTLMDNVHAASPLVHCITNYVTVNDCANILLAAGGSPIMADDAAEVADITSICSALVINIGTLNAKVLDAMIQAGQKANELGHPVVLDPVGAGASPLRTQATFELLSKVRFSVIRGNISEIKTVALGSGTTKGVDADLSDLVTDDNLAATVQFAQKLSAETGAVIAITGAIDVIANAECAYAIRNGHAIMSRITGTGCMLTCLIAAYCAGNQQDILAATATATALMGYAGEVAQAKTAAVGGGTSTFRMQLIDAVSLMPAAALEAGIKIEGC